MTVTTEDAAPWNGTKDNKPHLSHLMSRMDSDLSFNNDDVDEQALKPDAIHRSVSREAWYKVCVIHKRNEVFRNHLFAFIVGLLHFSYGVWFVKLSSSYPNAH